MANLLFTEPMGLRMIAWLTVNLLSFCHILNVYGRIVNYIKNSWSSATRLWYNAGLTAFIGSISAVDHSINIAHGSTGQKNSVWEKMIELEDVEENNDDLSGRFS